MPEVRPRNDLTLIRMMLSLIPWGQSFCFAAELLLGARRPSGRGAG
jgi:hypothetical protein